VLEFLARVELRVLAGGDFDSCASLRVHAPASLALLDLPAPEAHQRDTLALLERLLDRSGEGVDGRVGLAGAQRCQQIEIGLETERPVLRVWTAPARHFEIGNIEGRRGRNEGV